MNPQSDSETLFLLMLVNFLRVIPFGVALFGFILANRYSKVYVDLYDDCIKGIGFSKKLVISSFYLKKEQISSVSLENANTICINTNGISYRILSGNASNFIYYYRNQFDK